MRYITFNFLIGFLQALVLSGCAGNEYLIKDIQDNDVTAIEFHVRYSNGWSCHTIYKNDLSVHGGHASGGDMPMLHIVDDVMTEEFWNWISHKASLTRSFESIEINPEPDPVYVLVIRFADGSSKGFETHLNKKFERNEIQDLADTINLNQRIYIGEREKGWILNKSDTNDSDL